MRILSTATAAVACGLVLAGSPQTSRAQPSAEPWKGDLPVRGAYLRDRLPTGASAYLRVPDLFGLLTMPKGSSLDPALRSRANIDNARTIRDGLVENVLGEIPELSDPDLLRFIGALRSPLEATIMTEPAATAVFSVNLRFDSHADFEQAFAAVGRVNPLLQLSAPLDDEGFGKLGGGGAPIMLDFAADTGQLVIGAGPAVSFDWFAQLVQGLAAGSRGPMQAMERRIDESGQGFFLWLDALRMRPLMQMFMPPGELARLDALGLERVASAALGWGVADGRGRLALVADLVSRDARGLLPIVANDLGARAARGDPDAVFFFSIPDPAEFARLESLALQSAEPETTAGWADFKNGLQDLSGIRIEEYFEAVGPDLLVFVDAAGEYAALKLRDAELFDSIVARLTDGTRVTLEERRIHRRSYYHLRAATGALEPDDETADEGAWFERLAARDSLHAYWTRDDDYLYLASTPQVLIDRFALGAGSSAGEWLADTQKMDASSAVFGFSASSDKLPRRLYGVYLEVMQYLADLGAVEMDMWAMPTPLQLDLPGRGTMGFTLALGDPTVAAEFTFENNPAELLGAAGGAATIGVLAAIAIPAYQDYTARAKVGEGLALAVGPRAAVEAHYASTGSFPDPEEAWAMSLPDDAGLHTRSVMVEPLTGMITIEFPEDMLVSDGNQVFLTPRVEPDGSLSWECTASIEDKYLPASCRN